VAAPRYLAGAPEWTGVQMSWNDERVDTLRDLWSQGLSASQIAARLGGVSRNAVIGKAHRLGLEGRPSPIRGNGTGGRRRSRGARMTPTLTLSGTRIARPDEEADDLPAAGLVGRRIDAVPLAPPVRALAAQTDGRACAWPVGDPGDPGFKFCGSPAVVGRPYCGEHCAVAYIRKDKSAVA